MKNWSNKVMDYIYDGGSFPILELPKVPQVIKSRNPVDKKEGCYFCSHRATTTTRVAEDSKGLINVPVCQIHFHDVEEESEAVDLMKNGLCENCQLPGHDFCDEL